jgi:SusD/RagB-like outer membrane lipoprotein
MKITNILILVFFSGLLFSSCFGDLDTVPIDEDVVTAAVVYDDPASYKSVLAKLYAGLALSGQQGPAGQADISGIDEGFGQYLRGLWYHQEFTTDESVIGWNDQTIKDFHDQTWTAEDGFTFAFYSRIFYQIPLCNEFLRETTEEKLNGRGVDADLRLLIQGFRAEARYLRALSYWHALDLFRNVPFVTEDDIVGAFLPEQIKAPDLFVYIESELLDIESKIAPVRSNEYARADQGAVWALLAKLYLNAEMYTGTAKYTECITYCNKIINAGYTLEPVYQNLFLADNHNSNEVIFPVAFDGVSTRTWGGMTFIIRAAIGGDMDPTESGVSSGWGGTRVTRQLVEKFPENTTGFVVRPSEGNTALYPKVYIPGDYQGWDAGNTVTSLSSVTSNKIYEGYKYFEKDNSKILVAKFPSFSLVYGDNNGDGTLDINGDTIVAGVAGLYYIQVDFNNNTYILERREWGILGDATAGGWDSDIDMTWDAELGAMLVNIDLVQGEFKFRADDDWVVSLGDTGADAILTYDGDNLVIAEAGSYEIAIYLEKPDYTYHIKSNSFDGRGIFFTDGQNIDIDDLTLFTDGYAVTKFKNVTSDGSPGSDTDFPDTDFPMFRLADFYLMSAEATLRGGQGSDRTTALNYVNEVRRRAYQGGSAGNITDSELSLDFILDERARELYWECHRRTDLIRNGKFSQTNYLWAWKGGVKEGQSVGQFRDVFPIPSSDLGANPNLEQNDGY